ncbi:hypothetical protein [Tenacibaculum sp. 190524A02b]|uniref:hypothetical protein n=1 Tax=Tenacibaculum vairaonense TaxID=3137860 RepID=UPI0032B2C272
MMKSVAEENKEKIIETLKLLTFKEDNNLFEKIDFDNDTIFLEPLLFSYFNSKKNNTFPSTTLQEILQGYYTNKEKLNLKYSYNQNNIAYVPKLGYLKKETQEKIEKPLVYGDFEILKEVHPTQEKYFVEVSKGHIVNKEPKHKTVWKENYKELCEAIDIIKKHLPEFYQELVFANRKIYLHDNPKILNFTTVETLGMLYFYVLGKNNLIYFIEELIHQGSHNYLYYVVHNRQDYFKIDVDNLVMRNFTGQDWDYRTIYGAFHGLYTVGQRVKYFDQLLQKNVFSGREKHELLGRFTDQFERFRTGLELLNFDQVFTPKGLELYKQLDNECEEILKKYKILTKEFDVSNREVDFRYDSFCELNAYEEFFKKDKEGLFNF